MKGVIGSYTPSDIQNLVNAWDAAPRTVRRRYGLLLAIFAYAVDNDWLGRSPLSRYQAAAGERHQAAQAERRSGRLHS